MVAKTRPYIVFYRDCSAQGTELKVYILSQFILKQGVPTCLRHAWMVKNVLQKSTESVRIELIGFCMVVLSTVYVANYYFNEFTILSEFNTDLS